MTFSIRKMGHQMFQLNGSNYFSSLFIHNWIFFKPSFIFQINIGSYRTRTSFHFCPEGSPCYHLYWNRKILCLLRHVELSEKSREITMLRNQKVLTSNTIVKRSLPRNCCSTLGKVTFSVEKQSQSYSIAEDTFQKKSGFPFDENTQQNLKSD